MPIPSTVRPVHHVLRAAALLVVAVAVGCSKKPETAPIPEAAPATAAAPRVTTPAMAAAPAVDSAALRASREATRLKAREDSVAAAKLLASKTAAELKATLLGTVYFDYDRSELRDDTRAALEAKLPILQANSALRIRVQGHTDERGSDEYNLALGQRRAASVKRFFGDRGIDDGRIEVVSFGRERPAMTGEEDSARAKNRRAEFEILAGGEALAGPR